MGSRGVKRSATMRGHREASSARLDLAQNPFGPCPGAIEALEAHGEWELDSCRDRLRRRIGETYRTPRDAIGLTAGADAAMAAVLGALPGPAVAFPPSATARMVESRAVLPETILVARGVGRRGLITPGLASDLPEDGVAVLDSPSDPLGGIVAAPDAVRLARACRWVIVDERFAEFSGFSLLPLALEFPNIVVIRSFEPWAGIDGPGLGWVAGPAPVVDALREGRECVSARAVAAAMATLDDLPAVAATLRLVREERSRLFRLLRKFSFLQPVPSWGPFMSVRVDFVCRDRFVSGLAERGVEVFAPRDVGLEQFIRVGIGRRTDMEQLRVALLELAPEIVEHSSSR